MSAMSVMSVGIAIPSNSVSKYEHRAMGVGAAAYDNTFGGPYRTPRDFDDREVSMRSKQRLARAEKLVRAQRPGKAVHIIIKTPCDIIFFRSEGQPELTIEELQADVIAERGYRVRLEETGFSQGYHDCRIVPADDLKPEEMERMAAWEAAHPGVPPEPPDPRGWQEMAGNGSV